MIKIFNLLNAGSAQATCSLLQSLAYIKYAMNKKLLALLKVVKEYSTCLASGKLPLKNLLTVQAIDAYLTSFLTDNFLGFKTLPTKYDILNNLSLTLRIYRDLRLDDLPRYTRLKAGMKELLIKGRVNSKTMKAYL